MFSCGNKIIVLVMRCLVTLSLLIILHSLFFHVAQVKMFRQYLACCNDELNIPFVNVQHIRDAFHKLLSRNTVFIRIVGHWSDCSITESTASDLSIKSIIITLTIFSDSDNFTVYHQTARQTTS